MLYKINTFFKCVPETILYGVTHTIFILILQRYGKKLEYASFSMTFFLCLRLFNRIVK